MVPPWPMNMPTPRRSSSNRVTGGAAGAAGCWVQTFRDKPSPATPAVDDNRNFLRFMLPSRRRNSTVDWLLAAALAAAVIAGAAGIDVTVAGVPVRAHDAGRVLIAA